MSKADRAVALKAEMNCAQAVLMAYAEELGIDEGTLMSLGRGLGLGMGTTYGTCGALCAAEMTAGFLGIRSKDIFDLFNKKCGSTICRELKGIDSGNMLCSCDECVRRAVESVEELRG